MKKNKASILLFVLLILSAVAILIQQLVRSNWVGTIFNNRMIEKEQAKILAYSGINLAISQLTLHEDENDKNNDDKTDNIKAIKKMLKRVYPNLNKWQVFNLEKKYYGMDGKIQICISCENGKININEIFDFKKKEFKKEYQDVFKGLSLKGVFSEGEFGKILTSFLKKRGRKLDDISELLEIKQFKGLEFFYDPPKIAINKKDIAPNDRISLQDLFTTWTKDDKIDMMFLSDSMLTIMGLRRPLANDAEMLKDKYAGFINSFNKDWAKNWEENWSHLQPIYGSKSAALKLFNSFLSKEFGPNCYSVLSYGMVGATTQRLLAIIKEVEEEKTAEDKKDAASTKKDEDEKKESSVKTFRIMKIYWL